MDVKLCTSGIIQLMKETSLTEKVDAYIEGFSGEVKSRLIKLRDLIKEKVPAVEEGISYGMPAYRLKGKPLVYFAGYKNHIGFYATPTGHQKFSTKLKKYKQGKGSVQFPLGQELPLDLIGEIVIFRKNENLQKTKN